MKYIIDAEFIDTPTCSALISFAIVREDERFCYFEFDYPQEELTPWLRKHVVPHLNDPRLISRHTFPWKAAAEIQDFIGFDIPQFWGYFAAYDWYWFCRLWGGFMNMPTHWPYLCREFALMQLGVPAVSGPQHHALNDSRSVLHAMKLLGMVS